MSDSAPSKPAPAQPGPLGIGKPIFERLSAYRFTYVAIFLFLLLYVYSVRNVERLLTVHFRNQLSHALQIDAYAGPVSLQIEHRVNQTLRQSWFVRWGGCRVTSIVFAADGQTLLYAGGRGVTPLLTSAKDHVEPRWQEEHLFPLIFDVDVTIPHNAVLSNLLLLGYAALLLTTIFLFTRARIRREHAALERALAELGDSAARAHKIETELDAVWRELEAAETQTGHPSATAESGAPEGGPTRSEALESERQALEDLLDEALADLTEKDERIQGLEKRLERGQETPRRRSRQQIQVARRLRSLYKNLEFDDRAIEDFVALRDEAMRLKAEESIKRLSDEAENLKIRRKLGGLPSQLAIFELGFAGKGRIYYAKAKQHGHRILAIGAKNTQKADLDYLGRLEL